MIKRKNESGIKYLVMFPVFQIIHPETQANLQLKANVKFYPGGYLPEFAEVLNTIRQTLEKKKMPIEEAADILIDLFNEYEPEKLEVEITTTGNAIPFFQVSVVADTESSKKKPKKKKEEKSVDDETVGKKKGKHEKEDLEDEDEDGDGEQIENDEDDGE